MDLVTKEFDSNKDLLGQYSTIVHVLGNTKRIQKEPFSSYIY